MPAETDPVPWLPPFRLDDRVLLSGTLEAVLPPTAAQPVAQLRPAPDGMSFAAPPGLPEAAEAAAGATAAMRALGSLDAWRAAVVAARARVLRAVEAGRPLPAGDLAALCRSVPQALRGLGNALPGAEALALLRPLGRVVEIGAGMGFFARAMERAGLLVAASDAGDRPGIGIAFPVRRGFDAAATLDAFAGGVPPPLLLLWPRFEEGEWYTLPFARARPGQLVLMASPEFELCLAGGMARAALSGTGWAAAPDLAARLARDFEEVAQAPLAGAGWPMVLTPLRCWRRR